MELLRFANVRKDYGHRLVLRDVSFKISDGQKIGMIGANGAGKTSILRLITREESPSSGAITRGSALRVGYVPQHNAAEGDATVMQTVLAENTAAHDALRAAEARMAAASPVELDAAMAAYDAAAAAYERAGGDAMAARAEGMLDALGLAGRGDAPARTLSGGEQNVMGQTAARPRLAARAREGGRRRKAGSRSLEAADAARR
jgi:ATPase subunit of ABC transporter with duplicated ATPase domains